MTRVWLKVGAREGKRKYIFEWLRSKATKSCKLKDKKAMKGETSEADHCPVFQAPSLLCGSGKAP